MILYYNDFLYFLIFINNIYSYTHINYLNHIFLPKIVNKRICKRVNDYDIRKFQKNVSNIYITNDNRYMLLELKNNSIYNYKNNKNTDILGIIYLINIFK